MIEFILATLAGDLVGDGTVDILRTDDRVIAAAGNNLCGLCIAERERHRRLARHSARIHRDSRRIRGCCPILGLGLVILLCNLSAIGIICQADIDLGRNATINRKLAVAGHARNFVFRVINRILPIDIGIDCALRASADRDGILRGVGETVDSTCRIAKSDIIAFHEDGRHTRTINLCRAADPRVGVERFRAIVNLRQHIATRARPLREGDGRSSRSTSLRRKSKRLRLGVAICSLSYQRTDLRTRSVQDIE